MHDEHQGPRFKQIGGRVVRVDGSPATAPPVITEKGGWLDLFRAWMSKTPDERRRLPRHEAGAYQVWLGWHRGTDAFFANPARLVNLSRGGALVRTADPPPEGYRVWLCLGAPEPRDCVEAVVLEVRTVRRKECAARLEFREPCPHVFFEAAVCMLPASRRPKGAASSSADGHG